MKIFYGNPCDIVMTTAMAHLGTVNPRLVSTSLWNSLMARLIVETGATKIDIALGLKYDKQYPPPVRDVSATISLLCANWRADFKPRAYVFGTPQGATDEQR